MKTVRKNSIELTREDLKTASESRNNGQSGTFVPCEFSVRNFKCNF